FPSPAPTQRPRSGISGVWALIMYGLHDGRRAIHGPLADRGEHASDTVIVVSVKRLNVSVDRVCDGAVGSACLVLVNHRGAFTVMPHSRHEVFEPRPALDGEVVPGMARVMKVESFGSDGAGDVRPAGQLVEVPATQGTALQAREHQCSRVGSS